jgi:Sulfatase/HEAT repeats/PBS lyase HEAT-like repeat
MWLPLLVGVEMWATRHSWLSIPERLLLAAVAAAVMLAFAVPLRRLPVPRWLPWTALPLLMWLPLRWYPLLHTLLALVVVSGVRPMKRPWLWFAVSAVAAAGLLRISSNLRFVAFEQAPLTGPLLDGVSRLLPTPETSAHAHAPIAEGPDAPQLGDAHIVLITVDALRADRPLAHAPAGVRFERAYAQAPSTAFSISSLLTGAPPDDAAKARTLAEILRARGWSTQAFYPAGLFFDGRRQLEPLAKSRFGFAWTDTRTLPAETLTDAVLAHVAELPGEPRMFLWVHYFDTHEPYRGGRYDDAVAVVDREIGRLLDGLRTLRRPIIVCLTADHGEELGDHGGAYHNSSVYDEQVRVPLLFAAPGLAARTVAEPVELLDVAPTLLSLAAVEPARPLPSGHDAHAQVGTRRMLVRGRWKLIHDLRRDYDELYDLQADPRERHNLSDREIIAPLHAALDGWFGLSSPAALAEALAHGSAAARVAAARGLGERETGADALAAALDDDDAAVRAEAALALGAIGDARARPALVELLKVVEYNHRAAVSLGRLRDARAVPGLIEALRDATLGRHAAHYLGWLGGDEAVAPLMAASNDVRVRTDAYLALGRVAARTRKGEIVAFLRARLADEPYDDARRDLAEAIRLASP